MITLTMGPHFKESELKPSTNPENRQRSKISQVDVSEFKLSGIHEPIKNDEKVDKKSEEEKMTASIIQNETEDEGKEWWQYLRRSSED